MQDNSDSVELDRLIQRSIDESLSQSDAQKLNSLLENSEEARQRYNEIHEIHTALCEFFPSKKLRDSASPQTQAASEPSRVVAHSSSRQPSKIVPKLQFASALSICLLIGLTGYMIGKNGGEVHVTTPDLTHTEPTPIPENTPEMLLKRLPKRSRNPYKCVSGRLQKNTPKLDASNNATSSKTPPKMDP